VNWSADGRGRNRICRLVHVCLLAMPRRLSAIAQTVLWAMLGSTHSSTLKRRPLASRRVASSCRPLSERKCRNGCLSLSYSIAQGEMWQKVLRLLVCCRMDHRDICAGNRRSSMPLLTLRSLPFEMIVRMRSRGVLMGGRLLSRVSMDNTEFGM